MTLDELARLLDQYRAGIDAEVHLLRQLADVARHQREVTRAADFAEFSRLSDTRDSLTRTLVALEQSVADVRDGLGAQRDDARQLPGYEEVAQRHKEATHLVSLILAADQQSMSSLADAELARRSAVVSLERGETTLAAYRRVLSPPLAHASLVDTVG